MTPVGSRGKQVSGAQCLAFTLNMTEKATIYTKTAFSKDESSSIRR